MGGGGDTKRKMKERNTEERVDEADCNRAPWVTSKVVSRVENWTILAVVRGQQ